MADVASVNGIALTNIGGIVTVNVANIASLRDVPFNLPSVDLSTGLVGYYNFEESTGNLLNIRGATSSYPNGIPINSPTRQQTGKKNYAYTFNGTTQYIDCSINGYRFTTDMTISAWIYDTSTTGAQQIFSRYFSSTGYRCYTFGLDGNKNIGFSVYDPSNNLKTVISTDAPINANTWYHVVGVKKGTNMLVYVNDVSKGTTILDASVNIRDQAGSADGTNLHTDIGCLAKASTTPDSFFKGRIDEVALWNIGLAEDQIADLYNGGTGKFYTLAGGFA
jgi:hypothetical protein